MDFVLDIKEKDVGAVKAPSFPAPKSATTGFPEHKKRTRVSAFKKQRQGQDNSSSGPQDVPATMKPPTFTPAQGTSPGRPDGGLDRQAIDQENRDLLASMSSDQIEEERQELLNRLDPRIVQMLLKRANIDESNSPSPFDEPPEAKENKEEPSKPEESPAVPAEDSATTPKDDKPKKSVRFEEDDAPPPEPPADLFEADSEPPRPTAPSSNADAFAANTTHFPHPNPLPDLDPSDPNFLQTLHSKYFPNLPADPSKLAWMAPIPTPDSVADQESPYYPGQESLPISALRFDFKGQLLAPSTSRTIPVTQGLHHHGQAPEAAGYTIAELGILARSAVPAQRCIAFQTLGRILYKLGRGVWGEGEGDLAKGIWRTAQENRVMDSLLEAADVPEGQGHRGSRAYAVEALWLFEKGGWKEKFQGR